MNSPIPAPILSTGRNPDTARVRVSTATRSEYQILKGDFFVGTSVREGIPIDNDYTSVVKAPSDRYLIIEDAIIETIFDISDSSRFSITLGAYVDISNGNDWSYTPGTPTPIGRPLNASVVNNFGASTIDSGVTSVISGDADYPLFFVDYFLEVQGARENVSSTGTSFFNKGRQIVVAPNQELLIRTQTSGDSIGTVTLKTVFFVSEVSLEDTPSLLGELA